MLRSGSDNPQWTQLWAKTNRDKTNPERPVWRYHPLLCHLLDVAAVAGLVWDECLTPQLHERLGGSLTTAARTQIVFLSGAHDLGKVQSGLAEESPGTVTELRDNENLTGGEE